MGRNKKIPTSTNPVEEKKEVRTLPAFTEKINKEPDPIILPDSEPKKRHRRTNAEIMAERGIEDQPTNDTGFEMIVDILKAQADTDSKKFNLPICDKATFEPIAKNAMKLSNYFFSKYAKAWHYLAGIYIATGQARFDRAVRAEENSRNGKDSRAHVRTSGL
jgi:hypothetical protein